jgi:hypothetical protein
VNVHPPYSTAIQLAMTQEIHHFGVRHSSGSRETTVGCEQFEASCAVAHEQLSRDQIVRRNLIGRKQSAEFCCVRIFAGQKSDPDRGIDQHHLDNRMGVRAVFPAARHVLGFWLASPKRPETFVCRMSNQRFEAQTHGFSISGRTTGFLSRTEELIVNVQRLLHASH